MAQQPYAGNLAKRHYEDVIETSRRYSGNEPIKDAATMSMSSRSLIARLTADGWVVVRVRGSHHIFKHPQKLGTVVVPHPKKDVPAGTLANITKQAGWN